MIDPASRDATIIRRLSLDLTVEGEPEKTTRKIAGSLSGVDHQDGCPFLGSDEGPGIERLAALGKHDYGSRREFPLQPLFRLPGKAREEADIESISISQDWLWLVTSHARTRPKLDGDVADFARIDFHPRRYVLGRIPLVRGEDGLPTPVRRDAERGREARCLPLSASGSALTDALADDPHLKHSLCRPAKENGLDIEGIAVRKRRVVLGLRGPVLRERAMLLVLDWPRQAGDAPPALADRPPYRKIFLDLDGFGVRDLCRRDNDLLILAGPTMPLPASYRLYLEEDFFDEPEPPQVLAPRPLCSVPTEDGNPEGLTLGQDPGTFLLVVDGMQTKSRFRSGAILLRTP
jgi:Protein of unknown function (DUF3616)